MRPLFIMSLAAAFASLLGILGISVITYAPRAGAESERAFAMGVFAAFFVAWLCVAAWSRMRSRDRLPPPWLRTGWVALSTVYCMGVFLFVFG